MSQITKRAIFDSFKKVLNTKALSNIRISDITNNCGINRMTFYYHFKDIYDLIEWGITEKLKKAIAKNYEYKNWQEGFVQVFYATLKEKEFILKILPSIDYKNVEKFLFSIAHKLIINVVLEKAKNKNIAEKDIIFIARLYQYSLVGLLMTWVEEGMTEKPEDIVNKYSIIMNGTIERSIDQLVKK